MCGLVRGWRGRIRRNLELNKFVRVFQKKELNSTPQLVYEECASRPLSWRAFPQAQVKGEERIAIILYIILYIYL
jgi:hypothetical protein